MNERRFVEKVQDIVAIKNVSLGRIYWYLFLCDFIYIFWFEVNSNSATACGERRKTGKEIIERNKKK